MEFNQEEIIKKFEELPEKVKNVLNSEESLQKMRDVAKKFDLHIDQEGELSDLTTLLLLGMLKPKEYIEKIQNKLNLSYDTSVKITEEVNNQIIQPIKEYIKETYSNESNELVVVDKPGALLPEIIAPSQIEPPQVEIKAEIKKDEPKTPEPEIVIPINKTPEPPKIPDVPTEVTKDNPSQSVISIQKTIEKPLPQEHKIDPYREPIE